MKKLVSLIIMGCFLIQLVLPISVAAVTTEEPAKDSSIKFYRIIDDAKDEEGNDIPMYMVDEDGNIVEEEVYSDPETIVEQSTLPAKYDLRNYGYVTSVKQQGGSGACGIFSAISSFESSMIKQGYGTKDNTDYSEAHLMWFSNRQRSKDKGDPLYDEGESYSEPYANGVNWLRMGATLHRGSGLQLEANAPWIVSWDANELKKMEPAESTRYACYARFYDLEDIYDFSIQKGKQGLINNGNLVLSYYATDGALNEKNNCYYQNIKNKVSNHAVAVVGWDDNYPRTNFNASMRPKNNGAWLIKNSWGTGYADNGYFWLSYEDPSISVMYTLKAAQKSIYDNIYQYDGAWPSGGLTKSSSISSANRFKAKRNEVLTHIGFFNTNAKPVTVTAEIYRANEGYKVPSSNDPTENMTLVSNATTTVSNSARGYHTIKLNSSVLLEAGEYFTIKLTFSDPTGGTVYAAVEGTQTSSSPYNGRNYTANSGESFLYTDKWSDTTNINGKNYHNAPIKAMTKNLSSKVSLEDVTMRYKGEYKLQPKLDLSSGMGCYCTYTSDDPSIVTVDNSGNVVSQKGGTVQKNAGGSTTITCTVHFSDGSIATATCKVTVEYTWWQWILRILTFGLY